MYDLNQYPNYHVSNIPKEVRDEIENMPNYGEKTITYGRIRLLQEMARCNIWPDGSFGDDECILYGFSHPYLLDMMTATQRELLERIDKI